MSICRSSSKKFKGSTQAVDFSGIRAAGGAECAVDAIPLAPLGQRLPPRLVKPLLRLETQARNRFQPSQRILPHSRLERGRGQSGQALNRQGTPAQKSARYYGILERDLR